MAQNEFVNTEIIIDRIAAILEPHSQERVYDKEVSAVLRIHPVTLAAKKKRNSPPIKEILLFCHRTGLDPMKILF
jgi:hypothetical protein